MDIEPRLVQARPGGSVKGCTRPYPPQQLLGKRLVMTQLDGPQRLAVVRFEHDGPEGEMGPFDADAFEILPEWGGRGPKEAA